MFYCALEIKSDLVFFYIHVKIVAIGEESDVFKHEARPLYSCEEYDRCDHEGFLLEKACSMLIAFEK